MPRRKSKTVPMTNAQLQRKLKEVYKSEGQWVDRFSIERSSLLEARRALDQARRQLLAKEVEIGRLQGYIDRVLDEERGRHGTEQKGPFSNTLERLRSEVINGGQSLDEMSEDDIERLTGRDD